MNRQLENLKRLFSKFQTRCVDDDLVAQLRREIAKIEEIELKEAVWRNTQPLRPILE